jgi:hypothetical protein
LQEENVFCKKAPVDFHGIPIIVPTIHSVFAISVPPCFMGIPDGDLRRYSSISIMKPTQGISFKQPFKNNVKKVRRRVSPAHHLLFRSMLDVMLNVQCSAFWNSSVCRRVRLDAPLSD